MFALLVLLGTYAGLPFGLPGVASGVFLAVFVMWASMGRLSLELTQAKAGEFVASLRAGAALGVAVAATSAASTWLLRAKEVADPIVLMAAFAVAGLTVVLGFRALPRSWVSGVAGVLHEPLGRFVPRPLLSWLLGPVVEPPETTIQTP
jgi:hypothetical protein